MRLDQITCDISDALAGTVACRSDSGIDWETLVGAFVGAVVAGIAVVVTAQLARRQSKDDAARFERQLAEDKARHVAQLAARQKELDDERANRQVEAEVAREDAIRLRLDAESESIITFGRHLLARGGKREARDLVHRLQRLVAIARGYDPFLADDVWEHLEKLQELINTGRLSADERHWRPAASLRQRVEAIEDVLRRRSLIKDLAEGISREAARDRAARESGFFDTAHGPASSPEASDR